MVDYHALSGARGEPARQREQRFLFRLAFGSIVLTTLAWLGFVWFLYELLLALLRFHGIPL